MRPLRALSAARAGGPIFAAGNHRWRRWGGGGLIGRRQVGVPCRTRVVVSPVSMATDSSRCEGPVQVHLMYCPPLRSVASEESSPTGMEEQLEKVIYRCRFFTLLGVLGSLVGSILCFLKGCTYIASSFMEYFMTGGKVISMLIEAIDVYLIGTVMLVFGMGLYELFICNLDIAKTSSERSNFLGLFMLQERPQWLEIQSVNELKTKLGHVIVTVLLVGLFDKVQKVGISTPMDLLFFTASILILSSGLYLLSKLTNPKKSKADGYKSE